MGISIFATVNLLVFPKNFVCPGSLTTKYQETRLISIESQPEKIVVVVVVVVVIGVVVVGAHVVVVVIPVVDPRNIPLKFG